ncbi:MAG: M81 family metallopeptidase [Bacteroidota bacterium]
MRYLYPFILIILYPACQPSAVEENAANFKIGIAFFMHETCTFCPNPTGIEEWEYYSPPLSGDAVINATNPYVQGFVAGSKDYPDLELVGLTSPTNAKGGSSGSWVTKEAFDKYTTGFVNDIQELGPFDGIYLALHGAMAVTDVPRPEAEVARRIRKAVGDDVPIVVTLDFHGNEDEALPAVADAVFSVKRFPHYDSHLQGMRAARMMARILRGDYQPTMATRKPGIITPTVMQGTSVSPPMDIMERARRWEARRPDAFVSVLFGFPWSDVPDVGATVFVITNNDPELAEEIAQDMSDYIWRLRKPFAGLTYPNVDVGVQQVKDHIQAGETPVIVADYSDRLGDATFITDELIKQGVANFCVTTLNDPRALAEIATREIQVGEELSMNIGGYMAKSSGAPATVTGTLEYFGEYHNDGRNYDQFAVINLGNNNRIIVSPDLYQVTNPSIFEELGIDDQELDVIVLKSRNHFRRGFDLGDYSRAIVWIDPPEPFFGTIHLDALTYENIPDNLYPLNVKD